MERTLHLISGLPRSGSTLLAALLLQNPKVHAGIHSPFALVLSATLTAMSHAEGADVFITDEQRLRVAKSMCDAYFEDVGKELIFDSNRWWCAMLPAVAAVLPRAKVVCCVRNPAWILDSIERLYQRQPFMVAKLFGPDPGTVFQRVETLMTKQLVGPSLRA